MPETTKYPRPVVMSLPRNFSNCDIYRVIDLISHDPFTLDYNVSTTFQISLGQADFEKRREQILKVYISIEKAREHYSPFHLCFVSFTKAFDHVIWTRIWEIILDIGVPSHL